MATIARTAKAGGGTNFNSGQTIDPDENNTDFNTLYTEVNGNLDDANVETGTIPGAKSLRFTEISAPSSPSSNDILVYAKDDGAGVTRLYTKDAAGTERAVGAGTAAYVRLSLESATLTSGAASNVAAELAREISSGTTANAPSPTQTLAKFDAATDEHLCWTFIMPGDYSSGGTLRFIAKAASATSGAAYIKASIAFTTDSTTDDDAVAYATPTGASWAAPATQGQTVMGTIALTMTSVVANRKVEVFLGRDADGTLGTDDMTGDWYLVAGPVLEYTPA